MGVALLAVLGGGVGAVTWMGTRPRPPPPAPPPPPKYGSFTAQVEQTRKLLEQEPCDRKAVLKLSEVLLKGDAPRETIGVVDEFVAKCGPYERLLWEKFSAHKRLTENDQAIAVATTLMEQDPMDVDYPWWRGELLGAQGKVEEAVADYRLSLSLLPRARSIPFMLTDALFKAGRPCEAIEPMNLFLHFHPDQRQSTAVETRLAKLAEAKCEMTTGEGSAVFRAPVGATAFRGQVKVNGKATGSFIIDTGASSVVLSQSFADKLGLGGSLRQVRVRTAGGVKMAKLISLDAVEAQGAKSKRVEAVIIDDFGEDGLLGLSFLTRFEVQLESKTRTLTLRARPKTP